MRQSVGLCYSLTNETGIHAKEMEKKSKMKQFVCSKLHQLICVLVCVCSSEYEMTEEASGKKLELTV